MLISSLRDALVRLFPISLQFCLHDELADDSTCNNCIGKAVITALAYRLTAKFMISFITF